MQEIELQRRKIKIIVLESYTENICFVVVYYFSYRITIVLECIRKILAYAERLKPDLFRGRVVLTDDHLLVMVWEK